jgi:hypothetical protein
MRCSTCKGLRYLERPATLQPAAPGEPPIAATMRVPCPSCHGSGVEDCCGGPACFTDAAHE